MGKEVEVGPLSAERGAKTFGVLPVATSANGGELGIGIHLIAGARPGPRLVVMAGSHGNELNPIACCRRLVADTDVEMLKGELVVVPLQNPLSFEMGTRGTWIDGLWGDAGNMNRLWPGRANGWLTERFTAALSTQILPGAQVVMDLHGPTPDLYLSYGYLGTGEAGDLDYEIARVFGQDLLAWNSPDELREKNQTTSTAKAAARLGGYASYSGELGDFYGLELDHQDRQTVSGRRGADIGFAGVTNVMIFLGMLEGEIVRPRRQLSVTPELNLRPRHGGLMISHVGIRDLGCVLPKGAPLGTLISASSFDVLDEITAPFDETLLLASLFHEPFTKVHPGEFCYIVADNRRTEELG